MRRLGEIGVVLWSFRVAGAMVCLSAIGCSKPARTIEGAFPIAFEAAPWALRGAVWTGRAADAAAAVGEDWESVSRFEPVRVWLAVYEHQSKPENQLVARAFELPSVERGRQALEALRPAAGEPFRMGGEGWWTPDGVIFAWGPTLFEIFGNQEGWVSQLQAAYLAGFIEKKLPPLDGGR